MLLTRNVSQMPTKEKMIAWLKINTWTADKTWPVSWIVCVMLQNPLAKVNKGIRLIAVRNAIKRVRMRIWIVFGTADKPPSGKK